MSPMSKVLALIPARGGSKGVPSKNIKNLGNKPLIAHTIDLAINCKLIDRIIVSTDSDEIAHISKKYGAEVPFMRPEEISQDETPTLSVVKHAIQHFFKKKP